MKPAISAWLLLTILVQAPAGQTSKVNSDSFLLRISALQITTTPTAGPNNVSNCMIVRTDGRLHLELRRQEFFNGKASLISYEARLSTQELKSLHTILDSATVTNLQVAPLPKIPMDVDAWQSFRAEIQRGAAMQDVGYLSWHGAGPTNSEDDKRVWQEARFALQPLVEWSYSVKSFRHPEWRKVRNSNSVCGQ